jgi:hypothetical protein
MTRAEFCEKHKEMYSEDLLRTNDVLMRVASNLSDTQEMIERGMDVNQHLNEVKKYIFDFMSVLRTEEMYEREMKEFREHLGKF